MPKSLFVYSPNSCRICRVEGHTHLTVAPTGMGLPRTTALNELRMALDDHCDAAVCLRCGHRGPYGYTVWLTRASRDAVQRPVMTT